MPRILVLCTIYFVLFCSSVICAQEPDYTFRHLTTSDGLPSNRINKIIKDSDGFIWFGTGNGLTRYDGYSCKNYFPNWGDSFSYPQNQILSIVEDIEANLWIGTLGTGLCKFNKQTETFIKYRYDSLDHWSINHNTVNVVFIDKNNTIWAGTNGGGLNKIDPETKKIISYKPDPNSPDCPGNFIQSIYEDRSGILWIGTWNGVFQFDRSNNTLIPFDLGYKIPEVKRKISSIYEDSEGCLWFGTGWGLVEFNPKNKETYHFFIDTQADYEKQLTNISIFSFAETSERNNQIFWIATGFGLEKLNAGNKIFTKFYNDPENSNTLSSSSISNLYYDRSGLLWIGTDNGGVNILNLMQQNFVPYSQIDNPVNNYRPSASCFFVDKKKNIWVGTSVDGIMKLDSNFNVKLKQPIYTFDSKGPDVTSPNSINCIYEDSEETMWIIGGESIIYSFIESERIFEKHKIDTTYGHVEYDRIYEIIEDDYSVLWMATNSGLYTKELKNGSKGLFRLFSHDQLSHLHITDLYLDSYNYLWIGTSDNGLFYLTPSNRTANIFYHFETEANESYSISNNQIIDIYEDLYGDLWISTAGGLNRWIRETGKFDNFNHFIDPSSLLINSILGDNSGNIWLNTSKGLTRFNPGNNKGSAVRHFDTHDGLPFDLIGKRAFYKSKDGRIFVGGLTKSNSGFYCFYPDNLKDNTQLPPVYLTNFLIRNESVKLDSSITYKKEILLKYNENFFSFDFTALDYTNPDKNRFAYILEGYDEDWTYSENRRNANYTGVPPGNYTFRVKASNSDGYWNKTGTMIRLSILPPPWKTWWAYTIYVLVLGFMVYGLRKYDLKRQRLKQKLEIEHVESEKLKELDSLKSRFFANISHEFRTPLTLILGPLDKLLSKTKDRESKKDLSLMQRNAFRLQNLINQLLNLSKLESGKMKLKAVERDTIPLIRGYVQSFESLAKQKGIDLKFKAAVAAAAGNEDLNIPLYVDQEKLEKILFNLLSNAFKYTSSGGRIEIQVDSRQSTVDTNSQFTSHISQVDSFVISISDTGPGIPPEKLPHIFDRFYQVDDSYTKDGEGTGIGLALTKELVELHHGKIEVESEVKKGTTFRIYLPLGRDHLSQDELETSRQSAFASLQSTVRTVGSQSQARKL